MKLLVTGGAGFIGSCFVHQAVSQHHDSVVVLDALTYAGNLENLEGLGNSGRYRFVRGSIADADAVAALGTDFDAIVNFAAESHVDRSIEDPALFLETNVNGPRVLMSAAVAAGARFVQVSTDEVYGSIEGEGKFTEESALRPSSPYAASKAAADLLVGAYVVTYKLDAVITRSGNNYGPRQFPEKLVPLFTINALEDRELPLYGDGLNVRDWIHVEDHCRAIRAVLERGRSGGVYNVSAGCERTNREICERILAEVGKPWDLVRHVEDRPGHDRRYALTARPLREELGWTPAVDFEEGLRSTIAWYRDNRKWWQRVRSGEYLAFYDRLYGARLAKGRRTGPPRSGS